MDSINTRLIEILFGDKKLSSYAIAKSIGVATQNVDNWLKKKGDKYVMPGAHIVAKLCEVHGISPDYILLGKGPKYANKFVDNPKESIELKMLREMVDVLKESNGVYKKQVDKLEKQLLAKQTK